MIPSHSRPVYTKLTVASLMRSMAGHDLNIHVGVHCNYTDYTSDLSLFSELPPVAQIHCVDEIDWIRHYTDNYRYSKMHCTNVLGLLKNCRHYDFDYAVHLDNDLHITGDFLEHLGASRPDLVFEYFEGSDSVRLVTNERTETGYDGRVQFAPKPTAWNIAFSRRVFDRMVEDPSTFWPRMVDDPSKVAELSGIYPTMEPGTPVMFDNFAMLLHNCMHVWGDVEVHDAGGELSRCIRHFFMSSFNYGEQINHNSAGHLEVEKTFYQEFPHGIPKPHPALAYNHHGDAGQG